MRGSPPIGGGIGGKWGRTGALTGHKTECLGSMYLHDEPYGCAALQKEPYNLLNPSSEAVIKHD
jgi:hypothetical protein